MGKYKYVAGIFNADGGLAGELSYLAGKITGSKECHLCSLTHGAFSEKTIWEKFHKNVKADLHLFHINEQEKFDKELPVFTKGKTACMVAKRDDGKFEMLFTNEELANYKGDTEKFVPDLEKKLQ